MSGSEESDFEGFHSENEDSTVIYLTKTQKGREIIGVNGFKYRLDKKVSANFYSKTWFCGPFYGLILKQ